MKAHKDSMTVIRFGMTMVHGFVLWMVYRFLAGILEGQWMYFGGFVFGTVFIVYLYGVLSGQRDIAYKFRSTSRKRGTFLWIVVVLIWFRDIADTHSLAISLGGMLVYGIFNAYMINAYEWQLKWQYLIDSNAKGDSTVFVQIDTDMKTIEGASRKAMGLSLLLAFSSGLAAMLLWNAPFMNWIKSFILNVLGLGIRLIATVVLGSVKQFDNRPVSATKTGTGDIKDGEALVAALKETTRADYQDFYLYGTIILVAIILILLGLWVYWRLKKPKYRSLPGEGTVGSTGILSIFKGRNSGGEQTLKTVKPEILDSMLRKKYRALLHRLKVRGIEISPGETPDQIKSKLALIYPNQEALIDLITEAYCVRRYGDTDPTQMVEALEAFKLLKEVKYDRSETSSTT